MKKILSLALILSICATFFGCSKAIIYEEEAVIHQWLNQRTEGYVQLTPSSQMVLASTQNGIKIDLDTGADMIPELKIKPGKTADSLTENNILTLSEGETVFAKANHKNSVFNPYRNHYTRALQVWKKDDSTFRIFFWLYGDDTDFYPIPKLLTQSQYTDMLELVKAYHVQKEEESINAETKVVDYTSDFLGLYKASYFSDKAKNPDGGIYYECIATTEYAAEYRKLFAQLGLSEQDWRKSFEALGYTGQKLNLQIVYCDLTIDGNSVNLTLQTADAYTSALLQSKELNLQYSFCPAVQNSEGITVEVK